MTHEDDWKDLADDIRWAVNRSMSELRWGICGGISGYRLYYKYGRKMDTLHYIPGNEVQMLFRDGRLKEELETIAAIKMLT